MELSYSTLNASRNCHKFFINKQMGLPTKDFYYFNEGKEAHRIIQDHVSERVISDTLTEAGITGERFYFPVVEEMDMDPNCEIRFKVSDEYSFHGFVDGFNHERKSFLEIKTGATPWSLARFHKSLQRKIYAYGLPDYTEAVLINCTRDLKNFKKMAVPLTDRDRDEAMAWIKEGINIIEDSLKKSSPVAEGEHIDCPRCVYNGDCQWRQELNQTQ